MKLIVAFCRDGGIGLDGKLPWHFKFDMSYFRDKTRGTGSNAVIVGRKTLESIKAGLPGRSVYVLSRTLHSFPGAEVHSNIDDLLAAVKEKNYTEVWVAGGASVYKQFLDRGLVDRMYTTEVDRYYVCDAHFQMPASGFREVDHFVEKENGIDLHYREWKAHSPSSETR